MQKYDVIIIGAGAAGLAACSQLINAGITNVLILEAQYYIGGRIKTFHDWGRPLELGAEFIHGENMIPAQIAGELGLAMVPAYEERRLIDENGKTLGHEEKRLFHELLDYTISHGRHGVSVADIIESNPITKNLIICQLVHLSISDLETDDTDKLDSGSLLDALRYTAHNGRNFMLKDGYQQIVTHLAKDLPIKLASPVQSVDYSAGSDILVTLWDGEIYHAKKVILTVSLGVLQHEGIDFTPELPRDKQTSIKKLGMGNAMKLLVRLKDPHEVSDLFHYADGENGALQTITNWWASASDPRVLVGYCGGSRASTVLAMPEKRLIEKVVKDLSKILGKNLVDDLVDYKIVRWDDNPYVYGSYSYYPVGANNKDRQALAEPIDGRIFWAGEATMSDGNYATVHGAIASGYRVASEVMNPIIKSRV